MKKIILIIVSLFAACLLVPLTAAQNTNEFPLPSFVRYSGTLADSGRAITGKVEVTFSLYNAQQGGAAIWMESQKVEADGTGHYSAILGAATFQGLPSQLFASGEARWLGVRAQGYDELPRVMLVSVPYALKAGDAETVGGLPPSAFMLAALSASEGGKTGGGSPANPITNVAVISGSGTAGFLPLWTSSTMLGSSALFQTGSGGASMIGINTATPSASLDVNGSLISRGALQLPSTGTANTSQGFNSQPLSLQGSAFNSGSGKAIGPLFQWQTEPVGNNSSNPGGTLNLLYSNGSGAPGETGLNIASTGQITFASGQVFPGTGTISGVTAGVDLTGGGSSGNVTLNVDTSKVVTGITAGTDLIGGGTGGVQTLNLDVTKVPELGSNNIFTGTEQFSAIGAGTAANTNGYTPLALGSNNGFGTWMTLANTSTGGHTWNILSAGGANSEGAGNLAITDFTGTSKIFLEGNVNATSLTTTGNVSGGVVNASGGFNLAGSPFVTGTYGLANAFFGFNVGNVSMTGPNNFAAGVSALWQNTSGSLDTALGEFSLYSNTTGFQNTATGYSTLTDNTTGGQNTADGVYSLFSNTTGVGNTATGTFALVDNTTGGDNTGDGFSALYSNTTGAANVAVGAGALNSNTTGNNNTGIGYDALFYNQAGFNNTSLGIAAGPDSKFPNLSNATAIGSYADVTESNALILGSIKGVNGANASTLVGIGTTAPTQGLEVDLGNSLVRGANNYLKNGDTASLFIGDTNSFIQATFGTGITLGVYQVPAAVRINQSSGFVGIGTVSPDNLLSVNGTADKPGGGSWGTFSDARLKTLHGSFDAGLSQLLRLHPIRYRYKDDNAMGIRDRDEHVGFVAQDVQRVIPEAVTENNRGYLLVNNDPILWTMLNAIKEQQREIVALRAQLRMRLGSTTKSAATGTPDVANDRELRTVRQQLNQLRNKNGRLEARLARMERTLDILSSTNTLALASATATQEEK